MISSINSIALYNHYMTRIYVTFFLVDIYIYIGYSCKVTQLFDKDLIHSLKLTAKAPENRPSHWYSIYGIFTYIQKKNRVVDMVDVL